MKQLLILSVFLSMFYRAYTQNEPKENRFPQSEVFLRAKALGMCAIEDLWFRSFSAGLEYRFAKRISLSADYVHYRRKEEWEYDPDPYDSENYVEYASYDARNYWAFQMKYFLNISWLADEGVEPYISLLYKKGGRKYWKQNDYPLRDDALVGISGKFQDFGLLLGVQTSSPFGVDVSIGVRQRKETRWEQRIQEEDPVGSGVFSSSTYQYFDTKNYNVVMRVSLYLKLVPWDFK